MKTPLLTFAATAALLGAAPAGAQAVSKEAAPAANASASATDPVGTYEWSLQAGDQAFNGTLVVSRAAISMSDAVPCVPPDGWCIMMRACGSEKRFPFAPPASRKQPMLAAMPMQIVLTGDDRCCIVS